MVYLGRMHFIETLLMWQWLVFTLPLLLSFILLLSSALGGAGESGDADADGDLHGHAHHHEADVGDAMGFKFLAFFGVGRVPLMYLLSVVSLLFGGTGLIAQKIFSTSMVWVNLGIAFLATVLVTPYIARLVSKMMPPTETYVSSSTNQAGNSGRLVVTTTETFGFVQIKDRFGHEFRCKCQTYPGTEPLARGTKVVLVEYLPEQGTYYVEPLPSEV